MQLLMYSCSMACGYKSFKTLVRDTSAVHRAPAEDASIAKQSLQQPVNVATGCSVHCNKQHILTEGYAQVTQKASTGVQRSVFSGLEGHL
jgi:hypothetical protein